MPTADPPTPQPIQIGDRSVSSTRPFIIAEVAQSHDGSLGQAHAFIDAVARTGADAIKFQTHIASAESTPAEPWRVQFSKQDESRYDYWKRMEFTAEQWKGLKDHAEDAGLVFLSSPFSAEAVRLLDDLDMAAWKVASGETTNKPLLAQMMATGKPLLVSTGMSTVHEVDAAVDLLRSGGNDFALFQCTSAYPTPPERVGLNVLQEYQDRYDCPVGLSDHSGTPFPSLAAVTLGASLIEVHVTLSRDMFGPDVPVSLTVPELQQMVEGVHFIAQARAHPVDKDTEATQLASMRDLFQKSLVATTDLPAGTVLAAEHLTPKKPGTGLSPESLDRVLGRTLRRALAADTPLTEQHLEET